MTQNTTERKSPAPDQTPLTKIQASRLSSLTGIDAAKLAGHSVSKIAEEYRWQIDPAFLLYRRVCGRVVKKDPATGDEYPVPFATVYAEDTICNFLGLFPIDIPWVWFFPLRCQTEVVGETTTDACGNFCIWVPAFEIEWILRFRLERICYLELFTKPTIGAVLQYLQGSPVEAAAAPALRPNTPLFAKAEQVLGGAVVRQLAAGGGGGFGSRTTGQQALLARPAFSSPLPPALPKEFRKPIHRISHEEHGAAVRSTLANRLALNADALEGLNLAHYCGPFLRCVDILVPEWTPFFEVPDLSFRVTQDVNGTGTQEVIYSGGLFDVPWGTGNVSNITLLASPIAVTAASCNVPDVPCGDTPSLEFVGLMPLVNPPGPAAPYIDPVAGFATRPNAPRPDGTLGGLQVPPATAPYTGTLQLYGCTEVDGAVYYRLEFTYTPPGSTTPSALTPFKGLTWPLYRIVGGNLEELWPVSDAEGWYPVLAASDDWFPGNMVLEWGTPSFPDGLYTVQLEIADAGKSLLATSSTVGFVIDNSGPVVTYSAIWSFAADFSDPQPMPTDDCVVIDRGVTPADVYVQMSYSVTAGHLRSVQAGSGGCAAPTLLSSVSTTQHWYEDAADNAFSAVANYKIPAASPQGVYSFDVYADSRAFNPAGSDAGPLDDWVYNPVYIWTNPSFAVAVVNENP